MNCLEEICSPFKRDIIVERGCLLHQRAKEARTLFYWGLISVVILSVLLVDVGNRCPWASSKWYYVEYAAIGLLVLSTTFSFMKCLYYTLTDKQIEGTKEQKELLGFTATDNLATSPIKSNEKRSTEYHSPLSPCVSSPEYTHLPSWALSFTGSNPPSPGSSPSRSASRNSSLQNCSSFNASGVNESTSFSSPYTKYTRGQCITDETELQRYLRDASWKNDFVDEFDANAQFNSVSGNSFWNYSNTAATVAKASLYQLAPSVGQTPQNKQTHKEDGLSDVHLNSELIKNILPEKLSQYIANLRRWMAVTILQRVDSEIKDINNVLKMRGFSDIQIGAVGLERLKKTVENQQFTSHHVPTLPLILPFLKMSINQEYLVQRISELSQGTCISDYRWNCGSSFHGQRWDEHLPTDAAILFHLFCTYFDSQLMPLPQPGGRPFFDRYVIVGDKKSSKESIITVNNKLGCGILCTSLLNPKLYFISDKKVYNCVHDRNNLFSVILQFLIYIKQSKDEFIEGVSLGKSGINIMCVIED